MTRTVRYCGHDASFVADITEVAGAMVVRTIEPVQLDLLTRPAGPCDYWLVDFPNAGFWRPDLGVFVVPKAQLRKL